MKCSSALLAAAAAILCCGGCTASAGECKFNKIKLGLDEAQLLDVCGCGEPDERKETLSADGTTVELTFYPEHRGSYGGISWSSSEPYRPPPRTSSTNVIVTLKGNKVTSVQQDTTWTGVSR